MLAALLGLAMPCLPLLAAQKKKETPPNPLIETLQAAEGMPVQVELKTGESFNRAELVRANFDRKMREVVSLRIKEAAGTVRTVRFSTITVDREKVYEAPAGEAKTAAEKKAQSRTAQSAKDRQRWVAQAEARGVKPWPELGKREHQAAVDELLKFFKEVSEVTPGMKMHETQEFLFGTNIPDDEVAPYIQALDAMHDKLCTMYGIKPGEPVWRGKCLVLAFAEKAQFHAFEKDFMKIGDGSQSYSGRCHSKSDGRVIIACYRRDRSADFPHLLVHETSHGFLFRYRTPVRLPSWVNEGMAEWIATALVPESKSVERKQRTAIMQMRLSRAIGGDFLSRKSNIDTAHYGVAASMTDFLIKTDAAGYTRFIQGIKEGQTWEESLQASFNCKPDELVTSYGQAIGIPDLRQ